MSMYLEIKDQFNDTVSCHITGGRAYIGMLNLEGAVGEIELTRDGVERLRDWCDEVLDSKELE